jgi:hypothetical protein
LEGLTLPGEAQARAERHDIVEIIRSFFRRQRVEFAPIGEIGGFDVCRRSAPEARTIVRNEANCQVWFRNGRFGVTMDEPGVRPPKEVVG